MGFAEALSDDGTLTGRGHPWARGLVCDVITVLGGIGHMLPFLILRFHAAMTIAFFVGGRTRYHYLGSTSLHGDTDHIGRNAGGAGRCLGFRDRGADRQFLTWA